MTRGRVGVGAALPQNKHFVMWHGHPAHGCTWRPARAKARCNFSEFNRFAWARRPCPHGRDGRATSRLRIFQSSTLPSFISRFKSFSKVTIPSCAPVCSTLPSSARRCSRMMFATAGVFTSISRLAIRPPPFLG